MQPTAPGWKNERTAQGADGKSLPAMARRADRNHLPGGPTFCANNVVAQGYTNCKQETAMLATRFEMPNLTAKSVH
jgi:hypothetical protein